MPWKTMDVQEQRVQFVVAASRREKSFTALCQEFGISRPTGLLWRERYQQAGLAGIAERSRRPQRSPRRTTPDLEERVVEARQRYPDWGARKLQVILKRSGVQLTRSTIHRILLRRDLVREPDRRRQALQRFERGAPNELWQMDFKSPIGWNAPVGPLSVLDDHSRYLIVLQASRYDPRPPCWEYPAGTHVLKVDCQGKLDAYGNRWKISRALRGEWVQLQRVEQRVLVYYCRTLIRELDLERQHSTIVERCLSSSDPQPEL